jgi:hypothetical protein
VTATTKGGKAMSDEFSATNSVGEQGKWVMRAPDGTITEEPIERNLYFVPPQTLQGVRLKVLRFSRQFEMPKSAQYVKEGEKPTQTMIRLECRVMGGPGDGKKIAPALGWSIKDGATLGQVIRAAEGRDLAPGEQYSIWTLPGKEFIATIEPGGSDPEKRYCKIVHKTPGPAVDNQDDLWNPAA